MFATSQESAGHAADASGKHCGGSRGAQQRMCEENCNGWYLTVTCGRRLCLQRDVDGIVPETAAGRHFAAIKPCGGRSRHLRLRVEEKDAWERASCGRGCAAARQRSQTVPSVNHRQPDATGPAGMAAQPADPQGRSSNHGVQGIPSPAVSSEIGNLAGTLSSESH
jgi:hypothetical protein